MKAVTRIAMEEAVVNKEEEAMGEIIMTATEVVADSKAAVDMVVEMTIVMAEDVNKAAATGVEMTINKEVVEAMDINLTMMDKANVNTVVETLLKAVPMAEVAVTVPTKMMI